MLVASQHYFYFRKLPLRGYIYIPHWNHTFRFIVFNGLVYNGICSKGWCRNAANRFNELSMWNVVGYLNFMCFSLAKKTIFTLKSDPFFGSSCSNTIFLGFRKGHSPFAVNGDDTRLRQWLTLLLLCTFVFFVRHLEFMQIWTKCTVLEKIEIILFFGSEKLKKCTKNFNANFEG